MLAAARSVILASSCVFFFVVFFALVAADALAKADAFVYMGNAGVFNVDRYGFWVNASPGGLRGP